MEKDDKLIFIGVIFAAHGIKGNVVIKSYTSPKENIFSFNIVNYKHEAIRLKKIRSNSNGSYICDLASCSDRNTAEALKGTRLFCLRSNLPEPPKDEYYFSDLKDMQVLNENSEKIGTVINVANFGAGDIIEVKFNDNTKEMIPFTKEIFPKIDKNYIILSDSFVRIK
jgi:16S rRNA processing protein RimM